MPKYSTAEKDIPLSPLKRRVRVRVASLAIGRSRWVTAQARFFASSGKTVALC
jgi:hypothetical protein